LFFVFVFLILYVVLVIIFGVKYALGRLYPDCFTCVCFRERSVHLMYKLYRMIFFTLWTYV